MSEIIDLGFVLFFLLLEAPLDFTDMKNEPFKEEIVSAHYSLCSLVSLRTKMP